MDRTGPLLRWRRRIRNFGRNDEGATAVEFALVAVPFFALLFAILEVALIFFAQQVMDTGVTQAARLLRTGQAASFDKATFKDAVCERIVAMFDCQNGLKLEVRGFQNFSSIDLAPPLDEDEKLKDDFAYDDLARAGGSVVVVRAFYEWPTIVPGLGADMSTLPDGNRLLVSTIAFRNEPF